MLWLKKEKPICTVLMLVIKHQSRWKHSVIRWHQTCRDVSRHKWPIEESGCVFVLYYFFKLHPFPQSSFVVLETGSRKKHYCTLFSFLCNSLISISYLINALLYYSACSAQRNSTRCAAFKAGGVCCSLEDPSRWSCVQRSVFKGYSNTREYRY